MPTILPDNCFCSPNIHCNNSPDNIATQKSYSSGFTAMEEMKEPADVLGASPPAPALCITELKHSLAERLLSITMNKLNDLDINDKLSGVTEITGILSEVAVRHSESEINHSQQGGNDHDQASSELNNSQEQVKASVPITDLQRVVNRSPSYSSSPTATRETESDLNNGIETVSFDQIQHVIRKKQEENSPKPLSRSLSESYLHAAAENLNLNFLPHMKWLQRSNCEVQIGGSQTLFDKTHQAKTIKTPSLETLPHSQHGLVDEYGLPFNNITNDTVSPTHNENEGFFTENIENGLLLTPPISRCNSTAWSDSYNGSDSWEDLRTESQVLNSVNHTIRHELTNVQRTPHPPSRNDHHGDPPLLGSETKQDSDENVWRALRDKARATLPQSIPSHGRTIETQVPMNWPPKHGLHFYTDKLQRAQRKHSSSSTESEDSFDDSLTTYMQYSVSYQGDSGPRLLDKPSVELLEGTLLARWCKKDNRTWLWKSSRRWRRFQGFLVDPILPEQPPAGHFYAKRWKKDNRTWLWKSSIRQSGCKSKS